MLVHKVFERAEIGQPFFRMLMSDLHFGSPNVDHDAITADLEKAQRVGAKILLNGDIFDSITAKDPRFDLGVLHPLVSHQKDLASALIDLAKEVLWPYRQLIDIIGVGNHEENWIRHGNFDPVRHLITALTAEKDCKIAHGSFAGYIQSVFRVEGYRQQPIHRLLYMHGAGGDAPVTKGTIDFARKGRNFQFDAFTCGHRHNMFASVEQIADVNSAGKYVERRQLCLQTSAYYSNYTELTDETALNYSYATSKTNSPKPLGGVMICMRPLYNLETKNLFVHQDFMSDCITPWPTKSAVISQPNRKIA